MFRQNIVGVLAAVLLMTGCASSYGTSHTRADISDRYQEDEQGFAGTRMNYTMTRRNVITEIQGNPFHMDQDVFNLVTAQVLTAQQPGPRMYYQPKIDFRDLPAIPFCGCVQPAINRYRCRIMCGGTSANNGNP